MLPQGQLALLAPDRLQAVLAEKGAHRQRTQLDADDLVALLGQPEHVQTLAAQGHEDPAVAGQAEGRPESGQQAVHRALVEVGAPLAPELQPQLVVAPAHADCSWDLAASVGWVAGQWRGGVVTTQAGAGG
ncbi:hypothetical protein D3C81_1658620 [compost metagenome]